MSLDIGLGQESLHFKRPSQDLQDIVLGHLLYQAQGLKLLNAWNQQFSPYGQVADGSLLKGCHLLLRHR